MTLKKSGPFFVIEFATTAERLAYVSTGDEVGRTRARDHETNVVYDIVKAGSGSGIYSAADDGAGAAAAAAQVSADAAQVTANAAVEKAAGTTAALTAKSTVVDGDVFAIEDSAASNARKKVLFSTVITYFLSVTRSFLARIGLADGTGNGLFFGTYDAAGAGLETDAAAGNLVLRVATGKILKFFNAGILVLQLTGTQLILGVGALLNLQNVNTTGGTTGNQTINRSCGSVNIAAAGSAVTVTNNTVFTSSVVLAIPLTNDATALVKNVVCSNGSFVITMNAAVTAETRIGFLVLS